jgi:Tol biopolymer transport system component
LRISGDPAPVADQLALNGIVQRAEFSVSENGILVYSRSGKIGNSQLIWVDRSGKQLGSLGASAPFGGPSLSPDGKKLAVSINDEGNMASSDLWIIDVVRGTKTRLTFNRSNTSTYNIRPLWSPDGGQIVFISNRSGHFQSYQRAANGLGNDQLLWPTEDQQYASSWSSDGRFILLVRESAQANVVGQFWVLPTFGDRKPFPLLQGASGITLFSYPRISPDGKWMVYESSESGRPEIYVSSFPSGAGKWQVSVNGGLQPIWRRDGKEIFFMSQDVKIMAAGISEERDNLVIGEVKPLFQTHVIGLTELGYDVAPDGKKFLINSLSASANSEPLTLVVNWDAELKKK